jgi:hypothetical protein
LSGEEQQNEIISKITTLESGTLWNYLKPLLDDNYNLLPYNKNLIEKVQDSQWPYDIYFLINILIEQKTDKKTLKKLLEDKKNIWDKGNWSQKFWELIRENDLLVAEGPDYTVNEKGEKAYNVELYINERIKNNELGHNPILSIDHKITPYTPGELLIMLISLKLAAIEIIPKAKAISLIGKRGIDGMIEIFTRK